MHARASDRSNTLVRLADPRPVAGEGDGAVSGVRNATSTYGLCCGVLGD